MYQSLSCEQVGYISPIRGIMYIKKEGAIIKKRNVYYYTVAM